MGWVKRAMVASTSALTSIGVLTYFGATTRSLQGLLIRNGANPTAEQVAHIMPLATYPKKSSPALEIWDDLNLGVRHLGSDQSDSTDDKQDTTPVLSHAPICRVYGACVDSEGSLLLPQFFLSSTLLQQGLELCGIRQFGTYDVNNTVGPIMGVDLVGPRGYSSDKFRFLFEVTPMMALSDALVARAKTMEQVSLEVSAEEREVLCLTGEGVPCEQTPRLSGTGWNPIVGASPDESDWHRNVLFMMHAALRGGPPDSTDELRYVGDAPPRCVRSMVTSTVTLSELHEGVFAEDSPSFRVTGLVRQRVPTCKVQVIVVSSSSTGRLTDTDQLRRAVSAEKAVGSSTHLQVPLKWARFEDKTMHAQVMMMQHADIVVWARGPNEGNMLFLKPGSLVLEVLPLGLDPQPAMELAHVLGLQYAYVVASPRPWQEVVTCSSNETFLELYRDILQDWEDGGSGVSSLPWDATSEGCLSGGALAYDVEEAGRIIAKQASAFCDQALHWTPPETAAGQGTPGPAADVAK